MAASINVCRSFNPRKFITFCRFLHTKKQNSDNQQKETHFGFQNIPEEEKEGKDISKIFVDAVVTAVDRLVIQNTVYEVFKNVASRYDLMNDAMSAGIHRLWKDHFINRLGPTPTTNLLDVAGGTGDIAFRFLKYIENLKKNENLDHFTIPQNVSTEGFQVPEEDKMTENVSYHVTVCDINQEMLNVGKQKAENYGINSGMSWLKGNAECLPLNDNVFDAYTIAFGIRNCTHIDKVVEEAHRVLKPGGRFMCLEFSQVNNLLLRRLYDNYSFQVIPVMGQVLARDWKSYQYLVESIRQFPNQEDFSSIIRNAGFKMVTYENLTFGVAAIHSGFKL